MDSITQIFDSINTFSENNFHFSKHIEVLKLLKNIPNSISQLLNTDDFLFHLSQADSHIKWINDYFTNSIKPILHKELEHIKSNKNDVMIPYADFTVAKPPIFKAEDPVQLTFEDILRGSLEDGRPLKPVRRHCDDNFKFKGTCPFCGAHHEYIYDNNNKGQYKCKACKNTFT